jgi:hypothetical protein
LLGRFLLLFCQERDKGRKDSANKSANNGCDKTSEKVPSAPFVFPLISLRIARFDKFAVGLSTIVFTIFSSFFLCLLKSAVRCHSLFLQLLELQMDFHL